MSKIFQSEHKGVDLPTLPYLQPCHKHRTQLEKFNIFIPSVLVSLIFLQVCLTPAEPEVIFSLTSSREPPISLALHTCAQGLIEGVYSVQMCLVCVCVCVSVKGGFFYYLSFLINVAFFWGEFATNTHMHGCTHLCTYSHFVSSCATNIRCSSSVCVIRDMNTTLKCNIKIL